MHYLDNSATTQVIPEAVQKAVFFMSEQYGNASSLHKMGFNAKCELDGAREIIAKSIGAMPEEIVFTSGGTEGDNLAIFGAAAAKRREGNRIVTTAIEHSAVLSSVGELERQGFEVIYLKPDSSGGISEEQITGAIDKNTILVSIMLVNNETGAMLPVQAAAGAIRRVGSPALLHTDAVQGYLKHPISVKKLGADIVTVSGHKVHAPKGVGAMYIAKGMRIRQGQFGGQQERGMRPGTEPLPLIAAFAKAVEMAPSPQADQEHARELTGLLREELLCIEQISINSPENALPHILNISIGSVRAQTMLNFLSERQIYVSSGSACDRIKPSHVLQAMGLDKGRIESALRISVSRMNTKEDIIAFVKALKEGLAQIRS